GNWQPNQPVVNVTWFEAEQYCESVGMRLPTEAEWEKAARGNTAAEFPWGDGWNAKKANSGDSGDVFVGAAPVGSFPDGASPSGALDMAGNVWEWVHDWHASDTYATSPRENPQGPEHGIDRVVRGGSYASAAAALRTSERVPLHASQRRPDVGFRCAR